MSANQGQGNELDDFLSSDNQVDLEGDDDFEAAFNSARALQDGAPTIAANPGADADIKTPEDEDPAAAAAAAQAAAEAEATAAAQAEADRIAAEANAPVTITRAQLDAMQAQLAMLDRLPTLEQQLAQQRDSVAGRFGSLNQTIDALKAQAGKGGIPAIKALKRIEQEWPELGAMLREDLTESFAGDPAAAPAAGADDPGQGGQQDQPGKASGDAPGANPVDPLENPAVVKVLQQKEMAIVDAIHPGWRGTKHEDGSYTPGLVDSPEFKEWRAGLPPHAQQVLGSTWDHQVLKGAIEHFKHDQAQRQAAAQAAATAQAAASKQRDNRLAHAAPATTGAPTGSHALDEDAAFADGFNKARGR